MSNKIEANSSEDRANTLLGKGGVFSKFEQYLLSNKDLLEAWGAVYSAITTPDDATTQTIETPLK